MLTQGRSIDHSSKYEHLLRSVCGSKCLLDSHIGRKVPLPRVFSATRSNEKNFAKSDKKSLKTSFPLGKKRIKYS